SLIDSLKVTLTSAPKNPTSAAQNTMPARSSCPNRIKRSRVSSDRGTRADSRACKCIFRLGPVSVPSGRFCILAAHRCAGGEQDRHESRQIPTDFLAFQVASRKPLVHSMPESTRDLHLTFASLCARRARRARHVPGNPGVPSWQAPSGVRNALNGLVEKNDALKGKSLEELIRLAHGREDLTPVFNNAGQHWNHSFFWNCLSPSGGGIPGDLEKRLVSDFGSVEKFKETFKTAAVGQFGSGWAWL